jgi:hypothetical protein
MANMNGTYDSWLSTDPRDTDPSLGYDREEQDDINEDWLRDCAIDQLIPNPEDWVEPAEEDIGF